VASRICSITRLLIEITKNPRWATGDVHDKRQPLLAGKVLGHDVLAQIALMAGAADEGAQRARGALFDDTATALVIAHGH
jgi:hypothetical protein